MERENKKSIMSKWSQREKKENIAYHKKSKNFISYDAQRQDDATNSWQAVEPYANASKEGRGILWSLDCDNAT